MKKSYTPRIRGSSGKKPLQNLADLVRARNRASKKTAANAKKAYIATNDELLNFASLFRELSFVFFAGLVAFVSIVAFAFFVFVW